MTTPKIRLRDVRKQFGAKVVLDGVDLDVMPGESVVIIGGSGSGKSVTLKCILGLLEPDTGEAIRRRSLDHASVGVQRQAEMRKSGRRFMGEKKIRRTSYSCMRWVLMSQA